MRSPLVYTTFAAVSFAVGGAHCPLTIFHRLPGFHGLEGAAFQSRMPSDKLTSLEACCLPDIANGAPQTQKLYIYLRNRLVRERWLEWRCHLGAGVVSSCYCLTHLTIHDGLHVRCLVKHLTVTFSNGICLNFHITYAGI